MRPLVEVATDAIAQVYNPATHSLEDLARAAVRAVLVEMSTPTDQMLLEGCRAGIGMEVLLDDTRFSGERAIWGTMMRILIAQMDAPR